MAHHKAASPHKLLCAFMPRTEPAWGALNTVYHGRVLLNPTWDMLMLEHQSSCFIGTTPPTKHFFRSLLVLVVVVHNNMEMERVAQERKRQSKGNITPCMGPASRKELQPEHSTVNYKSRSLMKTMGARSLTLRSALSMSWPPSTNPADSICKQEWATYRMERAWH